MIDLHCHILPSVDDGAKSIDMSLKMAVEAKNNGIEKILLTPHHNDGQYMNSKKSIIDKANNLQHIFYDNGIEIEVRAGQEVHINGNLLEDIDNNNILYTNDNGIKYMMLELPHNEVPKYVYDMIFELQVKGITPIIVHPERNIGIQKKPDILYDLVKRGCLTQITATSYVGGFGKKIQRFTERIIDSGLGFTFSSDAHNLQGRRFRMREAFDKLEEKKGIDFVNYYRNNSKNIWNGSKVEIGKIRKINKKGIFSPFLHQMFGYKGK